MNWKINYWTLIAAFMAGCFIYSYMDDNADRKAPWKEKINQIDQNVDKVLGILEGETDCDDKPDTISAQEALSRMVPFIGKMAEIRGGLENGADNKDKAGKKVKLPANLSFVGLEMRKCETLKIFEKAPDGHAYIILTLEEDPKDTTKQLISAIVSDKSVFDEDGNLDRAKAGGATFFDFIEPCPPFCGGNGNG